MQIYTKMKMDTHFWAWIMHSFLSLHIAMQTTDVSEAGAPDAISCAAKGLLANTISSW